MVTGGEQNVFVNLPAAITFFLRPRLVRVGRNSSRCCTTRSREPFIGSRVSMIDFWISGINVLVTTIQWPRQVESQSRVLPFSGRLSILACIRWSLDGDAPRENARTLPAISLAPRGTRVRSASFGFFLSSPEHAFSSLSCR